MSSRILQQHAQAAPACQSGHACWAAGAWASQLQTQTAALLAAKSGTTQQAEKHPVACKGKPKRSGHEWWPGGLACQGTAPACRRGRAGVKDEDDLSGCPSTLFQTQPQAGVGAMPCTAPSSPCHGPRWPPAAWCVRCGHPWAAGPGWQRCVGWAELVRGGQRRSGAWSSSSGSCAAGEEGWEGPRLRFCLLGCLPSAQQGLAGGGSAL